MPRAARLVALGALVPLTAGALVLGEGWDAALYGHVAGDRPAWAIPLVVALTTLGGTAVLTGVVAGLAGLAWWRGWSARLLAPLLLVPAVAGVSVTLLKWLVARPRPGAEFALTAAHGWAFPSGHATNTVVVLGLAAAVASARLRGRMARVGLRIGLLGLAVGVGVSRFWLGVHWMSDVLAGFALGGFWLAVGLAWLHASARAAQGGWADGP